jgi:hypothetical protein
MTRSKLKAQNTPTMPTPKTPTTALLNLSLLTPGPRTPIPTQALPSKRKKPFHHLLDSFFAHPELTLRLCTLLDPSNLLDLYSISKPFHFIMNSHFTTYIRNSSQYHAPDSAYIFPWRCYRRLTVKDPGFRLNTVAVARDVPGFKWLGMVAARHRALEQILEKMREMGHVMVGKERDMLRALKKMWFLMDLPRNGVRIAVIHNQNYFSDQDIFFATFFLIKLDMRFGDPIEGTGEIGLRKLMMGQRSLYPLRDLLLGKLDFIKILKMWIYYDHSPLPQHRHLPSFGVHPFLIGRGCLEGWGAGNIRLLRPDELMVREQIRRSMELHLRYLEMVRWGYRMQVNGKEKSGKKRMGETEGRKELRELMWGEMKERERVEKEKRERVVEEEREREKRTRGRLPAWLLGRKTL